MNSNLKIALLILVAGICFSIWTIAAFSSDLRIDADYLAWVKTTATLLIGALVNHTIGNSDSVPKG